MLAAAGVLLLLTSVAQFVWTLRRGVYRRFPWEQFVLVGASASMGLLAYVGEGGTLRLVLLLVEIAALVAVTWYLGVGARFARSRLAITAGQSMPRILLPDSEGGLFDSDDLIGASSALYLFFRGDW